MAFRVNTNVSSLNTQRWLGISGTDQAKALERLSSGYKINKASDDAAGIAIATKLSVKSVAMSKSIDNGNQALSMLQTAEGGIDQISNILTRLKEIATQSASDNTTDRLALDVERSNLELEINKISLNTRYGATGLLQGSKDVVAGSMGACLTAGFGVVNIDVGSAVTTSGSAFTITMTAAAGGYATVTLTGASSTQVVAIGAPTGLGQATANFSTFGVKVTFSAASSAGFTVAGGFSVSTATSSFQYQVGDTNLAENQVSAAIKSFSTTGNVLGLGTTGSIGSSANALTYMDLVDKAITNLTTERGYLGATMNMISYHVSNLESMNENIKASISTVKDADFAAEMATFTKNQILQQSGVAMLAQANQIPQQVLSLLRG